MNGWTGPRWLRFVISAIALALAYAYSSYARRECEQRGGTMHRKYRVTTWGTSRQATCVIPK